jgi:DNA polymerase-3 subunit epsilon
LKYAVVDIETSGLSPKEDKIIEIAIVVLENGVVVDTFESLVCPEVELGYRVTKLTGITRSMVAEAPKFYELAKEVISRLKSAVFVAHNVKFDYRFVEKEFAELGYTFKADKQCTLKLSRAKFPGLASYRLVNLCQKFNIDSGSSHRAMSDALATADLFNILNKDIEELGNADRILQDQLNVSKLPAEPGVYYFKDEFEKIIYIGKSKNINSRIQSHIGNYATKKGLSIIEHIKSIDYELTGNEVMALLYENLRIKTHKPKHNRRQRGTRFPFGVHVDKTKPLFKIDVVRIDQETEVLMEFKSKREADGFVLRMVEKFDLCKGVNGLEKIQMGQACFRYQLKSCKGACVGDESFSQYNSRILQFENLWYQRDENAIYFSKGRKPREKSFVIITSGIISGFGFVPYRKDYSLVYLRKKSETFNPDKDYQSVYKILTSCGYFDKYSDED